MARPPGRLWWRLSSDLLVGDTRSWPETSPGTIMVKLCLTISSVVILLHPVTLCLDVAISYLKPCFSSLWLYTFPVLCYARLLGEKHH